MTRKDFESRSFDESMELLYDESDCLTTYEILKDFIIEQLNNDNNGLALHVLQAIYESEGDSEWFYYDYTAGTTCTPVCLNDADDVDTYIGFDEE